MTPDTIEDLSLDVYYGHFFNLKCERLYGRLDLLLNLVQLVGGSAAVLAVLGSRQELLGAVGLVLALAAALSLLVSPGAKAVRHAIVKDKFTALMGRYKTMSPEDLAKVIADYRVGAPAGIQLLELPAYNASASALGREDAVSPLSRFERVAQALS